MTTEKGYTGFVVLWAQDGETKRTDHINDRSAVQKAKDMSKVADNNLSQFGAVVAGKIIKKITFNTGIRGAVVMDTGERVLAPDKSGIYKKTVDGSANGEAERPEPAPEVVAEEIEKEEPAKRKGKINGLKQPRPTEGKAISAVDKMVAESVARVTEGIKAPTTNAEAEKALPPTNSKAGIAAAAKRQPAGKSKEDIVNQFKVREGTLLGKVVDQLADNLDRPVSALDLGKVLYGEYRDQYLGPIKMVMKGVKARILQNELPYALKETKENGEAAFVLEIA